MRTNMTHVQKKVLRFYRPYNAIINIIKMPYLLKDSVTANGEENIFLELKWGKNYLYYLFNVLPSSLY
jgi:hypothetical protein